MNEDKQLKRVQEEKQTFINRFDQENPPTSEKQNTLWKHRDEQVQALIIDKENCDFPDNTTKVGSEVV